MTEASKFNKSTIDLGEASPTQTFSDQIRLAQVSLRERVIEALAEQYKPKQRMRKEDRDLAKKIKSFMQGFDGTKAICYFCKQLVPISSMDCHHLNHVESDNHLENIEPACHGCNAGENRKLTKNQVLDRSMLMLERENELDAATSTGALKQLSKLQYSSKEGAKSEVMRARYNKFIRDRVNGAFCATPANVPRNSPEYKWHRIIWPKMELAKTLPYALSKDGYPFGSYKTYMGYIDEDVLGGILIEYEDEGILWVKLNTDRLNQLNQVTGQ